MKGRMEAAGRHMLFRCGTPVVLIGFAALIVVGCASVEDHRRTQDNRHNIEILSDPPGAKIEINDDYVGETPWTGWIVRGQFMPEILTLTPMPGTVTITAIPVSSGQYVQRKFFTSLDPLPKRIYFN